MLFKLASPDMETYALAPLQKADDFKKIVGAWVACRPEHPHQILKGMCACAATSAKPTVALIVVVKNGFGGRGRNR